MEKRVFLIVLDSFGIGAEPDAPAFGDAGTNTLGAIAKHPNFHCPNLQKLGLFNIDGVTAGEKSPAPEGAFARLQEQEHGQGHHHRPLGDRRCGQPQAAAHVPGGLPRCPHPGV